jgi:hypothetical protein
MEDAQGRKKRIRARLVGTLAVLVALLVVLIVPPMVSVSHYESRITHLIFASLGRPVRLSSVEVRLLPRPGFVLTDLNVDEDPEYGAEPILHANTVTASIRLLSLWRGRLEIGTISVDEASLNLVRTPEGHWNLDSLFRSAAGKTGTVKSHPLPYLEATNSRINIKNGLEKLPFSLVDTDLSFWQEHPGDWRIRLRGQPARTDLSLQQGDTGTVRLEASLHDAAHLRQMPIHLDLVWKDAQLGQLSKLLVGADPGWRGDLDGELHLDGTAESAQIKTRLRAAGVHRAEFAPVAPLDFDAQCGFVYRFTARSVEKLTCDSPLGNGHIRLAGDLPSHLPGQNSTSNLSVELDRIPVAAGLDALRTVRSDFGPGLEAKGTISGKMTYAEVAPQSSEAEKPVHPQAKAKPHAPPPGPLTGSFSIDGFQLSGGGLSEPIVVPKIVLEPASDGQEQALNAMLTIPAGGAAPLTVTSRLALSGYQLAMRGSASISRAKELVHLSGVTEEPLLDSLAGDPLTVDLTAAGPWMAKIPFAAAAGILPASVAVPAAAPDDPLTTDRLSGTVTLRNANWKADYLANHLLISQATLHLGDGDTRWDPVVFSYGPVKGTASLTLPATPCAAPQSCTPKFAVQFSQLDASALQAAILGAQQKVTLISTLLARLHPSAAPALPHLEGTVKAETLLLGTVTLHDATATVRTVDDGAEIDSLDASLLGGHLHGSGSLHTPKSEKEQPAYTFTAQFDKLSPAAVGQLPGQHWSGGVFDAQGKIELSGFTSEELASSAKGTLHFDWQHGSASGSGIPADLARFDRWTADAEVAGGSIVLKQNQIHRGAHTASVDATAAIAASPRFTFTVSKETQARR